MPTAPPSPCTYPGCHQLSDSARCAEHTRAYNRRRGSASKRGYGRRWQRTRAAQLQREPWCRECRREGYTRPATQVDHIVPKARGGTDDPSNLQSLCGSHHSRKTALELREDGRW